MLGLLLPCAIARVLGAANVAIEHNKLLSGVSRAAPLSSSFSSSSLFVYHPSPGVPWTMVQTFLTGQLANKFTALF